jgi:hypothetical protein
MVEVFLFLGDLILIAAAVGGIVFAFSYATFFAWRRTPAGRALMYFVVSLDVVFINNAVARFAGADYPFREWVRLFVYIGVAFTIWRLVWVLWRNWRAGAPPLDIEAKNRK